MKILKPFILSTICLSFFLISNNSNAQYFNFERLLGKENPFVSEIRGDSIFMYQRKDSMLHLIDKADIQTKILRDIRVLNRNQTVIEIWLAVSVLLNLACLIIIARLFRMLKK